MCKAVQYSDQMQCAPCGLAWDMNDPEPPECRPDWATRYALKTGRFPCRVVRVRDEHDKEHGRRTIAALLGGLQK